MTGNHMNVNYCCENCSKFDNCREYDPKYAYSCCCIDYEPRELAKKLKLDIEHKNIIKTTKFIIERKTFYIYKFGCKDDTKIKLIIVDGIKTDPPLADCLKNDPKYNEVFTIPSGIIHTYHSDWLDPKHDNIMVNETTLVCTKRDDLYAIQQYKKYLLTKVDNLKNMAKQLSQDARIAKKKAKDYEDFVNSLDMTVE